MNTWLTAWREIVTEKKSQLCVGCDPVQKSVGEKMAFARELIKKTAPYAAAVKINRQFIRDLSFADTRELTTLAHELDCLVIDDSKIADIGSTNQAALVQSHSEGFDMITQCPFPGNLYATCAAGAALGLGVLPLVLMSNPEFAVIRAARINDEPLYLHLARATGDSAAAGLVVGAPSPANGLTRADLVQVRDLAGERLALVPGLGKQGGEARQILDIFGRDAMLNVGRAIAEKADPAYAAHELRDHFFVC